MKWLGVLLCLAAASSGVGAKVMFEEDSQAAKLVASPQSASSSTAETAIAGADVGVASSVPPEVPVPKEEWVDTSSSTLKEAIGKWVSKANSGGRAHWILKWETTTDFPLDGVPYRFRGALDEAIAQWISLYEKADKPLRVAFQLEQQIIYVTNKQP